jgi:hypothetical protein
MNVCVVLCRPLTGMDGVDVEALYDEDHDCDKQILNLVDVSDK